MTEKQLEALLRYIDAKIEDVMDNHLESYHSGAPNYNTYVYHKLNELKKVFGLGE